MNSQPRTIFEWNVYVCQQPNRRGYIRLLNEFMTIAYTIIHDKPLPKIFPKQKDCLQFNDEESIGGWYLFDDYTKIRVYGADVPPYHLSVFPAMQIFSLEYIRQTLKVD